MSDPLDLLHRHLNGETLTEAEGQDLSDWVCASRENAELAAELTCLDQTILRDLRNKVSSPLVGVDESELADQAWGEMLESHSQLSPIHLDSTSLTKQKYLSAMTYVLQHTFTPKRLAALGAAAALLLGAIVAILVLTGPNDGLPIAEEPDQTPAPVVVEDPLPTPRVIATITAEYNAQWKTASGSVAPSVGDDLMQGRRLLLTDGSAQVTTGSGAVVTLQGPTHIRMHAEGRVELVNGKLLARCETPESKGFTVFTDTAEVTDIGTVFAVERDAVGQTTTGVLSGHVALSYKASDDEPRLLKTGDVAAVSAGGLAIAEPPADVIERFRDWGKLLRPVIVTGDAIFEDSMPSELHEDGQSVRVYRESTGVLLEKDLIVSRTEPGLYRPVDGNQKTTIAAGTRVDSYFVHIDRPRSPANFATRQFTIHFDQPVVALIVHTGLLTETTQQLGAPGVQYLKLGGLGLVSKSGFNPDNPQVDSIQWSDDRKTLTVTLNVQNQDQFRVLTLSPEAASADGNRE